MFSKNQLDTLIKSMNPTLRHGEFVFCSTVQGAFKELCEAATMVFHEQEGSTLIVEKALADKHNLSYDGKWAMVTLNIHASLNVVGFLARVTAELARVGISVNAVSAFHHEHLFVPYSDRERALNVLQALAE